MVENRVIQIEVPTEQNADWYELRIYSGRNEPVAVSYTHLTLPTIA